MKKVFALLLAVGMLSFMACGGAKDKEKEAKRVADSTRIADSTTKAGADTLAAVTAREAAAKAIEDSIAKAKEPKKGKK